MKLIFASDSFKGSLPSRRTAELLTRAAWEAFGACECIGVPIADGVVAAENLEQAIERCGTKQGNKGFSAMQAAIETANVLRGL